MVTISRNSFVDSTNRVVPDADIESHGDSPASSPSHGQSHSAELDDLTSPQDLGSINESGMLGRFRAVEQQTSVDAISGLRQGTKRRLSIFHIKKVEPNDMFSRCRRRREEHSPDFTSLTLVPPLARSSHLQEAFPILSLQGLFPPNEPIRKVDDVGKASEHVPLHRWVHLLQHLDSSHTL
jgi:hypothetical protein